MFAYLGMSETLLHCGRTVLPGKGFLVTAVCFGTLAASAFQSFECLGTFTEDPCMEQAAFFCSSILYVFSLAVCPGIHHL